MKLFFKFWVAIVLMTFAITPKSFAYYEEEDLEFPTSTDGLAEATEADNAQILALVGNDVYGASLDKDFLSVSDGKLIIKSYEGDYEVSSDWKLYKGDDLYVYLDESAPGRGVAFYLKNGAISQVVFDKIYYTLVELSKQRDSSESELVSIVGDQAFGSYYAEQIVSVIDGKVCLTYGGEVSKVAADNCRIYQEGNYYYLFNEEPNSDFYIFCMMGGKFDRVEKYVYDTTYEYYDALTLSALAPESEIVDIIGDRKYFSSNGYIDLSTADGHVVVSVYGEPQELSSLSFVYGDNDNYSVIIPNYSYYHISIKKFDDGTSQLTCYDPKEDGFSLFYDITDEAKLIELMGDKVYMINSIEEAYNIHVENGHICMCEGGGYVLPLVLLGSIVKEGDNYVFEFFEYVGEMKFTFVMEEGKIACIRCDDPSGVQYFINPEDLVEVDDAKLAALMGDNKYVHSKNNFHGIYFKVSEAGQVQACSDDNGMKVNVTDAGKLYRVGDDFLLLGPNGEYYLFVTKDGKLARVDTVDKENIIQRFIIPADIEEVIALIGDKSFVNPRYRFEMVFVDENNHVVVGEEDNILDDLSDSEKWVLSKEGNGYVARGGGFDTYTFVVVDGEIQRVEFAAFDGSRKYVAPSDYSEVVALVGSDEFYTTYNDGTLFANEGALVTSAYDYTYEISEDFYVIYKECDNYVCSRDLDSYTFVVENGVLVKILYSYPGGKYTYVASKATANSASAPKKAAPKVVKTVEDGRVVIIRDNEKFDLAGRKL